MTFAQIIINRADFGGPGNEPPKHGPEDWPNILAEAHAAAVEAVAAEGPENMNAFDCGFAWVVLRPATHRLVFFCKGQLKPFKSTVRFEDQAAQRLRYEAERTYGHKHWNGGWEWNGPGNFSGQAIGHKLAGARAFQAVLARYNISAEVGSRYD